MSEPLKNKERDMRTERSIKTFFFLLSIGIIYFTFIDSIIFAVITCIIWGICYSYINSNEIIQWKGINVCPYCYNQLIDKKTGAYIKKDRIEIAKILEKNRTLMYKNKRMCQDIADCIIVYMAGGIK